jgi:uncharacterized protein with PQ loop repeat
MTAAGIIGILVGVVSIVYNLPFTYRIVKNGSARDVDSFFLLMRILGVILYIAYGVLIIDYYIIAANIVPMICTVIIVTVKIRYSKRTVTWDEVYQQVKKTKENHRLDTQSPGWSEFKNYVIGIPEISSV